VLGEISELHPDVDESSFDAPLAEMVSYFDRDGDGTITITVSGCSILSLPLIRLLLVVR
jgi:hypothetical protein